MEKRPKGPVWKKGMMSAPPVYHPPQELADPEAHLTEEQKKWPVVDGWAIPPEKYKAMFPDGPPPTEPGGGPPTPPSS